jgi:hypothetical protein
MRLEESGRQKHGLSEKSLRPVHGEIEGNRDESQSGPGRDSNQASP